jgi:hypothetical protein
VETAVVGLDESWKTGDDAGELVAAVAGFKVSLLDCWLEGAAVGSDATSRPALGELGANLEASMVKKRSVPTPF